jgi:hypothetical protein
MKNKLITGIMRPIVCIMVFFGLSIAHANDQGIIIGTAQYIDNINPFSYTVYPAELIVQFTTERLIQQVCTDSQEPSCGFEAIVQKEQHGIHTHYNANASVYYVVLNPGNITNSDIQYTIDQINKTSVNRFHEHQLFMKNEKLKITHPEKAAFGKAGIALTFPIIKSKALDNTVVINGPDNIDLYNQATTGRYALDDIQQYKVVLKGRHTQWVPIHFQIDVLWETFAKNIMSEKAHIGLSVSGDLKDQIPKFGKFDLIDTDDLNSFTYFGFNYEPTCKHKTIVKNLFHTLEFRQAFAFAVCNSPAAKDLLKYGYPMKHTFDTMRIKNQSFIDYMAMIPGKVKRFVQANIQPDTTTLRVLYRANLIFTQEKMGQIVERLNTLFADANIKFRTTSAPQASEFLKKKKAGDFEIIFDTLIYGQNKLRYIEFMNPDNTQINYLKCKLFFPSDIIDYKKKIELRDRFLMEINQKVPVFVLGAFPSRNAVSKRLIKSYSCKNGRVIPFTHIHSWKIQTVTNTGTSQ